MAMKDLQEVLDRATGDVNLSWEKWKRDHRPMGPHVTKKVMLSALVRKLNLFADNLDEWCDSVSDDDEVRKIAKGLRRKAKSIEV